MYRRALFVLFALGFIDAMAFGLVYPLFSSMLFNDAKWNFLPSDTSETIRGLWLGILLSSAPIVQMLISPFAGNLSDRIGRRPVIVACLLCGVLASLGAIVGIELRSLYLLTCSRIVMGISIASFAVANAAIADISTHEDKGQNYAWMSMAFGLGFAIGPVIGGIFSGETFLWGESLTRPFYVGSFCIIINASMIFFWLPETCTKDRRSDENIDSFFTFFKQLTRDNKFLLFLLGATFLYCFGWSFYIDFIPVWWVRKFEMTTSRIGWYFTYGALWYVVLCGFVVGPVMRRCSAVRVLEASAFSYVIFVWALFFINTPETFWVLIPLQNGAAAFFFPVAATAISEMASKDHQGRVMGLYGSVESLGTGIAPVVAGPFLGIHLLSPVAIGGFAVLMAALLIRKVRRLRQVQ